MHTRILGYCSKLTVKTPFNHVLWFNTINLDILIVSTISSGQHPAHSGTLPVLSTVNLPVMRASLSRTFLVSLNMTCGMLYALAFFFHGGFCWSYLSWPLLSEERQCKLTAMSRICACTNIYYDRYSNLVYKVVMMRHWQNRQPSCILSINWVNFMCLGVHRLILTSPDQATVAPFNIFTKPIALAQNGTL